jgi:hypothetical protein
MPAHLTNQTKGETTMKTATVQFRAMGAVVRTVRVRAGEQWQDAAARAGIQLGTANSIDDTVRLAEYNGQRGEARLVEAR